MFHSIGDGNWWRGVLTAEGLRWSTVGNTAGFGNLLDERHPMWVGDFDGDDRDEALFHYAGDGNWWLGGMSFGRAVRRLAWTGAGNTSGFGHLLDRQHKFWTGRFTPPSADVGTRDEILFYYLEDGHWWLGRHDGQELRWYRVSQTSGADEPSVTLQSTESRRLTGAFPEHWNSTVRSGNIIGADLGHMFDLDGVLYMVFGDSYGEGSWLPPNEPHSVDWRSNVMAVVPEWRTLPADGFNRWNYSMITSRPNWAKELLPSAFARADQKWPDGWAPVGHDSELTKIPSNGMAVEGWMFLHFFSVHDWGHEPAERTRFNYASLAYSSDRGHTWLRVPWAWSGAGSFCQVAFARDEGFIYLFGIPAGRLGGVRLARVRAERIHLLNNFAYEYFRADRPETPWLGRWIVADESAATDIVSPPVGELSVMFNPYLNRWTMLYASIPHNGIMFRHAPRLSGPWSAPTQAWGPEGGSYGGYMHPFLVENDGESFWFTVSRWDAYQTYLMKAHLSVDW